MSRKMTYKSQSQMALLWYSCLIYLLFLPVYGDTYKELVSKRGYLFFTPRTFLNEDNSEIIIGNKIEKGKDTQWDWMKGLFLSAMQGMLYIERRSPSYPYSEVKENKPVITLSIGGHAPPYKGSLIG